MAACILFSGLLGALPALRSLPRLSNKGLHRSIAAMGPAAPPGTEFRQYDKIVIVALRAVAFGGDPAKLMADAEKRVLRVLDR